MTECVNNLVPTEYVDIKDFDCDGCLAIAKSPNGLGFTIISHWLQKDIDDGADLDKAQVEKFALGLLQYIYPGSDIAIRRKR